jgi:Protein of unknown function (DUF2796)
MKRLVEAGFCMAMLGLASNASLAHEPGPHQHGVAQLQVAADGPLLTLTLESPLDNLLGFEHYPRTDKQKAAVRALDARMHEADALFVPTPAAHCAAQSVRLESLVFEPAPPSKTTGHADLDAEYQFSCAQPEALRDLEVRLFEGFPNMRRINVQVAGPRGQSGATLDPSKRRLSW